MIDQEFEKIIARLRDVSLTKEEKQILRADFLSKINHVPQPENIESPYMTWFQIFRSRKLQLVLSSFAVILILGTGVTFASKYSLPGSLLYSVKTKVYEPVARVFNQTTPTEEANFEIGLVQERLDEAEKLEDKDELNVNNKKEIKEEVIKQKAKVEAVVNKAIQDNKLEVDFEVESSLKEEKKPNVHIPDLEKVLDKHKEIIRTLEIESEDSDEAEEDKPDEVKIEKTLPVNVDVRL